MKQVSDLQTGTTADMLRVNFHEILLQKNAQVNNGYI